MLKKIIIVLLTLSFVLTPYSFSPVFTQAQTDIYFEDIRSDTTWTKADSPYIIENRVHIASGATLTIEPGVVIKFKKYARMTVLGNLIAQGLDEEKIVFTSVYDSEYGGDTSPDSTQDPKPGDWSDIMVYQQAIVDISNVIITYGGLKKVEMYYKNNFFKSNTVLAAQIMTVGVLGVFGSEVYVENSIIRNNLIGVYVSKYGSFVADFEMHNCEIYDNNTETAIWNTNSAPIDVVNNWWGHASGPYHEILNPDGQGGEIDDMWSNSVTNFIPWLTERPLSQEPEPEIDPLILKYEPILYLHPDETYQPMNVEAYVAHSSLWDSHRAAADELLKPESTVNPVTLEDLNFEVEEEASIFRYYLQFSQNLEDKMPDIVKAKDEYLQMKDNGEVKYTYYVRKMIDTVEETGDEYIVLQYWYFYAMSDFGAHVEGGNVHEGDWEVVMVFLDKETEEPKYVAHSVHYNRGEKGLPFLQYESIRNSWDSDELNKNGDHVFSLVGLGSHANYSNSGYDGVHYIDFYADDITSTTGLCIDQEIWHERFVFNESDLPDWLVNYQGYWGVYNGEAGYSGTNPPYYTLYNKFNEPIKWAGIDKIGKLKVLTRGEYAFEFAKQSTEIVFDREVDRGTVFMVDLRDGLVRIGENIKEIVFLPHFWDIESNLENESFNAEVSFEYNPEELESMDITEDNLVVWLYDEDNNFWEKVPSVVDIQNKVIKFFTTHFSRYAIGAEKWQDISEDVKVVENFKHYDKKTETRNAEIKIKNETKKEIVSGDLRIIVKDIDKPEIEWLNYTDVNSDGEFYLDVVQPYKQCVFIGTEEDALEDIKKTDKKKLLNNKPMEEKICEKMIKKYPQLEDDIEWVLRPKRFSDDIVLEFGLPAKETKIKNFKFKVKVLNKIVEW